MFDSKRSFAAAGFTIKGGSAEDRIMVGSHPTVPNYLFKKFMNDVSADDQRENFEERIWGAYEIRHMIEKHRLHGLIVPHKWIYDLPSEFATRRGRPSQILVVEKMAINEDDDVRAHYRSIDDGQLEQLCRVLHRFTGFDAAMHNLRFTTAGQIAFIDTESCRRKERKGTRVMKRIREELSSRSRRVVSRAFDRLDDEDYDDY